MSATTTALVAAWRLAGPETRELVAILVRAAWSLNRALAVPAIDPGWDRPEVRDLTASSTAEQVLVALDAYEVLALRFDGMPLDVLFSPHRVDAPDWGDVETIAQSRGGTSIAERVREIRATLDALVRGQEGISMGRALDTSAARHWLFQRLNRVASRPGSSSGTFAKVALVGLILWAMGGDRK